MGKACSVCLAVAAVTAACAAATASASACRGSHWLGAWAASPSDTAGDPYAGRTLRVILTPTGAGRRVRVRISNRLGERPLVVERAAIARRAAGPELVAGSSRALSFGGLAGTELGPGAELRSDPVRFRVRRSRPVAVSIHLGDESSAGLTRHRTALQSSFAAPSGAGDATGDESGDAFSGPGAETLAWRPLVAGLEVRAPRARGAVVAFGDSITDGLQADGAGVDLDRRYPDFLARRLAARGGPRPPTVLNAGISGNSLLFDYLAPFGPSGLDRLEPDVVRQPGAESVIVLEGRNDLPIAEPPQLIAGLRRAFRRLRAGGLEVLAATMTPSDPGTESQLEADRDRRRVNRWIRRQRHSDAVVDFDRALRDPARHGRLAPAYDSGDGLHPSSAGYSAMARAVPLSALSGPDCGDRD